MTPKGHGAARDSYNQVARNANLRAIALTGSRFNVTREFLNVRQSDGGEVKLKYGSSIEGTAFHENDGMASCTWQWEVAAKIGRKKALSIQATYLAFYGGLSGCDEEAVVRFLHRVAKFATYPYFRAHVSHVSWESGLDLPIMPVIST